MFNVTSKSDKTNYLYIQGARVTSDKNDTAGVVLQNFNNDQSQKKNLASITSQVTHISDSNNAGDLMFKTMSNDNLEERMRLDARGHLGINTTDPEEILTVNGNTYVRSNLYVDQDIKTTKLVFEPHNQSVRSLDDNMFAGAFSKDRDPSSYLTEDNYVQNISTIEKDDHPAGTSRCKHVSCSYDVITHDDHAVSRVRTRIPLELEDGKAYEITLSYQLQNQQDSVSNMAHIQTCVNNDTLVDAVEGIPVEYDKNTDTIIRASPVKNIHMFYEKKNNISQDAFELRFKPVAKNTQVGIGYVFVKIAEIVASPPT